MSTVRVEPIENYPALKMTWQHDVRDLDVVNAFKQINTILQNSTDPVFVVVDLSANPNFPLLTTIHEAIAPYRNPLLEEWLVIGSNWMARAVEGTLAKLTRQKNVRWFTKEVDVMDYLSTQIDNA
ncbi:MAG: hypothetical protein ABI690_26135 [Chloroflexota bacterium]